MTSRWAGSYESTSSSIQKYFKVLASSGLCNKSAWRTDILHDLEAGRGFLWWPIAFGSAAAFYFVLSFEPSLWITLFPALFLVLGALWARIRFGRTPVPLSLAVLASLGFMLAKIATEQAHAPVLTYQRTVTVTGVVEVVEDRGARGHRLRIKLLTMEPQPREGLPLRARIALRSKTAPPEPGEGVRILARLGPPQAPLYPGGYDFGRMAYFERIGAVGFAMGAPERLELPRTPDMFSRLSARTEILRLAVSDRIRTILPGDAGAIAAALIVGDRGAITPETDDAMRISGLSHILSISGLHMALVAACLFGGLRAVFALIPPLALSLPVKTIAAGVALVGTLAYLVIAGMSLPTQRSAIMIGISLFAVMIGRQAFSMRTVAIAALVVMAIDPHAVLDPGAQLSFIAVMALIAGFEVFVQRKPTLKGPSDINPLFRFLTVAGGWIGASMLTSLLAGFATAPIALYHFNRFAPLGLFANLAATPLVSFIIMPAGLVAALALPFGLERLPLMVMGFGIDGMVAIAKVVAAWTPGGGTLGQPTLYGTLVVVAGMIWLCLWTKSVRFLGIPVMLIGLVLTFMTQRPDLIVAGDGRRALLHLPGHAPFILGRTDGFETAIWLAAIGDARSHDDPTLTANVHCDPHACILRLPEGENLEKKGQTPVVAALVTHPVAFAEECLEARLIVTPLRAPIWCRATATVIDIDDVQEKGTTTYSFSNMPDRLSSPKSDDPALWTFDEIAHAIHTPRRPFTVGTP